MFFFLYLLLPLTAAVVLPLFGSPCIAHHGRYRLNPDGSGTLDWPSTSLTLTLTGGTMVTLLVNTSVPIRFRTVDAVGGIFESVVIAVPGATRYPIAAGFQGRGANHTFEIEYISDQAISGLNVSQGRSVTLLGIDTDGACLPLPPALRGPPTWRYAPGFIGAGNDLLVQNATVEAAQGICAALAGCKGFTYASSDPNPPGPVNMFFKGVFDESDAAGWSAYQLVSHRVMTFVGDSITAGTGAACTSGGGGDMDVQDHSLTYAALLAANFSARDDTLAYPGKGMVQNCCGDQGQLMPSLFLQTLSTDYMGAKWDFAAAPSPDCLFLYLGTNDMGSNCGVVPPALNASFTTATVTFVQNAVQLYRNPQLPVFLLLGPMSLCPQGALMEATAQLLAQGVNATFIDMSPGAPCDGCWNHPGEIGHQRMFENAQPVVARVMGW